MSNAWKFPAWLTFPNMEGMLKQVSYINFYSENLLWAFTMDQTLSYTVYFKELSWSNLGDS